MMGSVSRIPGTPWGKVMYQGSKQGCFTGKSPTGARVVDWEVATGLQWGSHS
jgi:hypothetical protein